MNENSKVEELIIPADLKIYLNDIADSRFGYRLGEPWKYSEENLGVVVPILRETTLERQYTTMYEVLKDLNIKDTGSINQVELQNEYEMAIFVRAGTIFKGSTQPRAAQHSGIYKNKKEMIKVCCVNASYGIHSGEKMKFGDIAPPSITMNLMTGDQHGVWSSIRDFTNSSKNQKRSDAVVTMSEELPENLRNALGYISNCKERRNDTHCGVYTYTGSDGSKRTRVTREYTSEGVNSVWSGSLSDENIEALNIFASSINVNTETGTSDLLGHLEKIKKGQSVIDDMMQRVPLFPHQVGAIIFNPVGVIALETFDHPKSWESIKKEIIEKYGDKIKETQAEHLFELKPEAILPAFKKFIDGLDNFTEKTIRKDEFSETREVVGKDVIGEYTLVKGQPIHVLLLKKENIRSPMG